MKKKLWIAAGMGFLVGLLSLFAFRFFSVTQDAIHYHANFAVYINGQREEFNNFTFYEEIAACTQQGSNDPKTRVHMHGNVNDVVHVHDDAVTWGAFFANLGFVLGDHVIQTDNGLYVDGQDGKKLTFLLNGQPVQTVANRVIGDKDVFLVSYGSEDQAGLQKQYDSIPHTAGEVDSKSDPATCSGNEPLTPLERAKKAVGIE